MSTDIVKCSLTRYKINTQIVIILVTLLFNQSLVLTLTFFQFKSVKKISIFFFKFLILSSKEGGSSNLCRCDESCYAFGDCCFDAARTFGQTKLSAKPNAPLPQCVKYHDGKVKKNFPDSCFFSTFFLRENLRSFSFGKKKIGTWKGSRPDF